MGKRPRKSKVRPGNCGNPVVPLGHRHPTVGETPDDHAEGERDHEEVDTCGAQRHQTKDRGNCHCEQNSRRQGHPEAGSVARGQDTDAIGSKAEVSRMPQRSQTRIAENDVETHSENCIDQRLGQQREQERGEEWRRDEQKEKNNRRHHPLPGEQSWSHHARP